MVRLLAPEIPRERCRSILRELLDDGGGTAARRPLGDRAVAKRYLTANQLEQCLTEQAAERRKGRDILLGQVLLHRRFLTVDQLVELLELPPPSEDKARRLGKYRLIREVGRGGMGIVYEAEDTELRRRAAVKVLLDREASLKEVQRFHREAEIAAQLKHPGIVSIYEVNKVPNASGRHVQYIAMEYVEGTTLAALIERKEKALEDGLRILADVAHAVGHAHRNGVVHRDLKPTNIIVENAGRVVLTDFGLARMEGLGPRLTHSLDVIGTPLYMAPEQVAGKAGEVDSRTDVYALGVILYEILTGRPPFRSATPAGLYEKILRQEPTRPSLHNPAVSRDLEIVCLKALEKDRKQRYADGEEFAADLERFQRGDAIQARPLMIGYRIWKWVRRRKAMVALFALMLAAGGGALLLSRKMNEAAGIRERIARARELEEGGRLVEARTEYRTLLQAYPANAEARAGTMRVDETIADRKRRCLERAQSAESENRFEEALVAYLSAQTWDPDDRAVREAIERMQRRMQERKTTEQLYAKAEIQIRQIDRTVRASQRPPTDAELGMLVSTRKLCLAKMGDTGDSGLGWYAVGKSYELTGNWHAACRAYRKSLKSDSGLWLPALDGARLYCEWALYLKIQGPSEGAARFVQQAQDLLDQCSALTTVTQPLLDIMHGYCLIVDGGDADLFCEEMLAKWRGRDEQAAFHIIRGLSNRDRWINEMSMALESSPASHWAYFWRGVLHAKRGEYLPSIADWTGAVATNPWFVLGYQHRGSAHEVTGHLEPAITDYSTVIRMDPSNGYALTRRAHAREKTGDRAGALQDAQAALQLTLPPDDRANMEELVRTLRKTP